MTKKNIILAVSGVLALLVMVIITSSRSEPTTPANQEPMADRSGVEEEIRNNMHRIKLQTSMGEIVFETYDKDAPETVKNFITLAEDGFYDDVIFHRIISGFMVQGGDPTGTGRGGPGYTFDDELNPETESYQMGYQKGTVAMANSGPNTNGSQFFIMLEDYPLPKLYTIFGKVVEGQEVVDSMGRLPTDRNDRPEDPPVIQGVSVEKN